VIANALATSRADNNAIGFLVFISQMRSLSTESRNPLRFFLVRKNTLFEAVLLPAVLNAGDAGDATEPTYKRGMSFVHRFQIVERGEKELTDLLGPIPSANALGFARS
jgi:hypothetical protein